MFMLSPPRKRMTMQMIQYRGFDVSEDGDNDGMHEIKTKLNAEKSRIDEFQCQLTKEDLRKYYGTSNKFHLLKRRIPDDLRRQILMDISYSKFTSKICTTDFKKEIAKKYNVRNFTNAGLKFYEVLCQEDILPLGNVYHFANSELPGSFLVAVNFFRRVNNIADDYNWVANSLLSGLEDSFGLVAKYPDNWMMSSVMNGDICIKENLDFIKKYFEKKKVNLYTSDAGIDLDIGQYNDQEKIEGKLKMCEVYCGMISLQKGGNLVIKFYTFFESQTVSLFTIMKRSFRRFRIVKPMTSKATNSEVYAIGIDFQGCDYVDHLYSKVLAYDDLPVIPDACYLKEICGDVYFQQISHIKRNIRLFSNDYIPPEVDVERQFLMSEYERMNPMRKVCFSENL